MTSNRIKKNGLKKIAVLVATYNGANWIETQIRSIENQKNVDVTIFISDDCSTDATLSIVSSLNLNCPLTILPIIEGMGSAASNFFRLFRDVVFDIYDYVFLSDQDDYWLPYKIVEAINYMLQNDADCYASNLVCIYADGRRKLLRKDFIQTASDYLFQGASAGCTYGLSNAVAIEVQKTIKNYSLDEFRNGSHDWIIYAITRSRGYKWCIDSRAFIDYRQHENNAWGALGIKSYIKRLRLLKNGWYRDQILQNCNYCKLDAKNKLIVERVKIWGFTERVLLALNSYNFRRRPIEKIALLFMIICGFF